MERVEKEKEQDITDHLSTTLADVHLFQSSWTPLYRHASGTELSEGRYPTSVTGLERNRKNAGLYLSHRFSCRPCK